MRNRAATIRVLAAGSLLAVGAAAATRIPLVESAQVPAADLMFFVPLASPEPLTATPPNGDLQVRFRSLRRSARGPDVSAVCEFEMTGNGSLRFDFDHSVAFRQHERKLRAGDVLRRRVDSIACDSPAVGRFEVSGTATNGTLRADAVAIRFAARGGHGGIAIRLRDYRLVDGSPRGENEMVVRLAALRFSRSPGPPSMAVNVDAVRRDWMGDGLCGSLIARTAGVLAGLFVKPVRIADAGHDAVLDFGSALLDGARTFAVPSGLSLDSVAAPAGPR
jgi:hypothetical protein